MYEEEDDDLPSQYRRLTAHLQTSNPVFNSRLSAYLTNNVAMRRILEQTIQDSYAQQYNNAQGQQQYPLQPSFPSPLVTQHGHQQQQQPSMMYPPQSPSTYRTAPYPPRAQQQSFQPTQHQRSASIAVPQEIMNTSLTSPIDQPDSVRRMSMPTTGVNSTNSPVQPGAPLTPLSTTSASPQLQQQKPSFPPGSFSQQFGQQSQPALMQPFDMSGYSNFPFTTTLSANVQGLLGDTLDMNDPFTAQMMAGSGTMAGTFYDFSTQPELPVTTDIGKQQTHPSFDGLTATLAPAALDDTQQITDFSSNYFNDAFKAGEITGGSPGQNNDWSAFFDTAAYEETSP
jgi:hypothetical protein